MNGVQMETLLRVVEEGSFEGAAAVLGISPSAVSQRVKALESATGRVLVRRTTPVEPTEAGEIIVQTARRVALVEAEAGARLGRQMSNVPLSVAINADSLHSWFQPVIGQVADLGEVALRIRIEDENATLGMLRRGDVVGAVTTEPTPVAGCEASPLGEMSYFPMAAPGLLDRLDTDWAGLPLVMYSRQDPLVRAAATQRGLSLHDLGGSVSYIPNIEAYNEAIRVGLGWGMIPLLQARPLIERGELVMLDERPLVAALYWQRWKLESELLDRLSNFVHAAAATLE